MRTIPVIGARLAVGLVAILAAWAPRPAHSQDLSFVEGSGRAKFSVWRMAGSVAGDPKFGVEWDLVSPGRDFPELVERIGEFRERPAAGPGSISNTIWRAPDSGIGTEHYPFGGGATRLLRTTPVSSGAGYISIGPVSKGIYSNLLSVTDMAGTHRYASVNVSRGSVRYRNLTCNPITSADAPRMKLFVHGEVANGGYLATAIKGDMTITRMGMDPLVITFDPIVVASDGVQGFVLDGDGRVTTFMGAVFDRNGVSEHDSEITVGSGCEVTIQIVLSAIVDGGPGVRGDTILQIVGLGLDAPDLSRTPAHAGLFSESVDRRTGSTMDHPWILMPSSPSVRGAYASP